LGGAVGDNGDHAVLRFDTSVIPVAETIVDADFRANIQAGVTPTSGFRLWASEFGSGNPTIADYNKAANNVYEGGATGTLRVELGEVIAAQAYILDDEVSLPVPSRFIRQGGSEVSDFEIRPDVAGVPGAGHVATIYGGGELTEVTKIARLTGFSLTDAELRAENTYRFTAVGAESFLALGVETSPGVPVKPNVLLDLLSSTLDGQAENLQSQALSRQRARPRKMAVGREGASGAINIELTPERWGIVLLGMMEKTVTNDLGVIGAPPVQTYEHVFQVATTDKIKTFTGVQKNGAFFQVFPGLTIGMIDISAQLDAAITANIDFAGRSEFLYDWDSAGGETAPALLAATAGYDSVDNAFYSFVGGAMEFDASGDVDGRCITSCRISLRQNVNEKRGFTRKRRISGHYVGGFEVEVSFEAYFENEVQLRKYLGVTHTSFPFTAEQDIQFQAMTFSFAGTLGVTNQELLINVPKMVYSVVRKPVQSEDAIKLDCTAFGVVDAAKNGNVEITWTNGQAGAFFDPLTDLITILPEGA
jgi:hypothetical protein